MMKHKITLLTLRLKVTMSAIVELFKQPKYALLSILASLLSGAFLMWSLNLDLVSYIIFDAPLTVVEKIQFFATSYRDLFTTYESTQAMSMLLFMILFGLNISLLVYVIRNQGFSSATGKSSAGGLLVAVLGSGCLACGTSLLAPLLATFGAVSGAFMAELAKWLLWVGSLFIIFSIITLSQIARTIQMKHKQSRG
jgi:hypothetical protein